MEIDLVFEGGGAKGIAFVGALQALERHNHKPRRVLGTSAGSITACLVAAGYSAQECLEVLSERMPNGQPRFVSFMDTPTIYEDVINRDSLVYWLRTELNNPLVPDIIEPVVANLIENLLKQGSVRHLVSLLLWGGWYAGDEFVRWLQEKLDADGRGLANSTFLEFYQKPARTYRWSPLTWMGMRCWC